MNTLDCYTMAGILLVTMGLHGLVVIRHLVRRILAVNVMASGIFVLMMALARRTADGIPDPVPEAMVLTGIVVSVSATALGLRLICKWKEAGGSD